MSLWWCTIESFCLCRWLCLIAPTARVIIELSHTCKEFSDDRYIEFNPAKSECLNHLGYLNKSYFTLLVSERQYTSLEVWFLLCKCKVFFFSKPTATTLYTARPRERISMNLRFLKLRSVKIMRLMVDVLSWKVPGICFSHQVVEAYRKLEL